METYFKMLDSLPSNLINDIHDVFFNPQKRIFWGYLLSALAIAILWMVFIKRKRISTSIRIIFSPQIWLSKSSRSDYKILLINKIIMLALSPLLFSQLAIATLLFYGLHDIFPSRPLFFADSSTWVISVLFTTYYFLLDDFARFYIHRLMHLWPALWAFHKVHHSAETLTPFTVFRTHPVEMILFSLRGTFVQAFAIASFVFFVGDSADLVTIFGANIFIFAFNTLGSNLRHSHIQITYPKLLEKILISPAQHQIHHSSALQHRDKNFGVILSIWDRCFQSLHNSEKDQDIKFGLQPKIKNCSESNLHDLNALYTKPFKDFYQIAIAKLFFIKKKQLS